MRLLYSFSINLYILFVRIAALFGKKKAKLAIKGRRKIVKQYTEAFKNEAPWTFIWVHVSSLGEFEQGRPFIEKIKTQYPQTKLLLTFFSPSGFEKRKNYHYADKILYLPFDRVITMAKVISIVRPKAVFFIKYDFWFNMLNVLHNKGIPVYFISSVFRRRQYFFWWFSGWFREHLRNVETFFVQNEESVELLEKVVYYNVEFVGDTRLDRVIEIAETGQEYPLIENFIAGRKVLILGSSWLRDEKFLLRYIFSNPQLFCIIAPHEIHEKKLLKLQKVIGENCVRLSQLKEEPANSRILLIDTIGDLAYIYKYADVVHIGNGFGKGIHNILEPVAHEKPVIFGPNYKKFPEAVELIKLKGAFSFSSYSEYAQILDKLLNDREYREQVVEICKTFKELHRGATTRVVGRVEEYFWKETN